MPKISQQAYSLTLLLGLGATIFICTLAPRAMAFLPAFLGLAGLMLLPLTGDNRPSALHKPALIFVALIFILACLSAFWSINPGDSLIRALKIAGPLFGGALLFGVLRTLDKKTVLNYGWTLIAVTWVSCLLLVYEIVGDFKLYRLIRDIDPSMVIALHELNRSAVILCVLAPVMTVLLMMVKLSRFKWASILCFLAPYIFLLLLTGSQSAQISFVAGMITVFLWPVRCRIVHFILCAGYSLTLLIMPFIIPPLFQSIPTSIQLESGEDSQHWAHRANVLPRLEVWDYVSRYALQSPFTGFGLEATRNVPAFDTREIYQPGKTNLHPHNAILQVWIEFGLIGIGLLIAGGLYLFSRIRHYTLPVQSRLALATLAGLLSVSAVGYGLWQGWWLGLIALSAGLSILVIKALEE